MTAQELINALTVSVNSYEAEIASLKAEVAALKAKLPPSGIVKVVITDVDMSKVTFS